MDLLLKAGVATKQGIRWGSYKVDKGRTLNYGKASIRNYEKNWLWWQQHYKV